MEIRSLRHFVVLADTLSFRHAAERLHMSQPALTRSIASLEHQLGVRLFHRDKRHVALTPEGSDLLTRARRLLAGMDEFAFAAHSLRAASQQVLRVGVYGNGLAQLTHLVFQEFRRRYPEVRLQVMDADFHRGIGPLLAGEYHVALLRAPAQLPELRAVPVFLEPIDVLLPRDHRLAGLATTDVAALFDEPWVTFPPSIPGAWAAHWLAEEQRGEAKAMIGSYARTEYELYAAVAYQGHVALVPRSALRMRPHPGIVAVPVSGMGPSTAAVAMPAVGYDPAAAALADVATGIAREHIGTIEDARLPSGHLGNAD
jgi:DNA-binding transcriptional LysR family regulator